MATTPPFERSGNPRYVRVFSGSVRDRVVWVECVNGIRRFHQPVREGVGIQVALGILWANPGRMHDLVNNFVAQSPHAQGRMCAVTLHRHF